MKKFLHLSPPRIIALSFLLIILTGTLLLMLPSATNAGSSASLKTALFTATSATCVTGLVLQDTAQYWSGFGQAIIICLIQIGGMGVVTVALILMMSSGKKIGLKHRIIMQESIAAPQMGGIMKMVLFILKGVLLVELLGALILSFRFIPQYGLGRGIWFSIFHSISAFCNAGFDLMGVNGSPFVSMTAYSSDVLVSFCLSMLILIGGLGFATWRDVLDRRHRFKRYSLQSKLILCVSAVLVLGGFAFMFFYEFSQPQWSYMSTGERVTSAFFQTVTPRTAGFNTVDLTRLSMPGQLVLLLLMLIGGAPASTAGGFKMTTIALLILCIKAAFTGKDSAEAFGRRISDASIRNATALFSLYVLMFLFVGTFICAVDNVPLMAALFESASAIATVGLTLGITTQLSTVSHILLIFLMFFGRVGGLTLIYAVAVGSSPSGGKFPIEQVAIG